MRSVSVYIILFSLISACGTVSKSAQKSPAPETQNSSENKTSEEASTNYPYGDLIEHAQLTDSTFLKVCETASDSNSCESYRLVKAYYPTAEDKSAAESGQFKKTCEHPQGAADQYCDLFRVEKSSP